MKNPSTDSVHLFTAGEKRELFGARFRALLLDGTDFSDADLALACFEDVSLRDCDFRHSDLRGARFLRCDLRGAAFADARLGGNRFHGSTVGGTTGLTEEQLAYVSRHGGSFE